MLSAIIISPILFAHPRLTLGMTLFWQRKCLCVTRLLYSKAKQESVSFGMPVIGIIKDRMAWAAENNLSSRTINSVLSTMRVAVNYAVEREELDRSPFRNVKDMPDSPKEKGILTFDEMRVSVNDILGPERRTAETPISRRWAKRMEVIETLPESVKKHILRTLDDVIKANTRMSVFED